MKASDGFVLRNIAGERMLLPVEERIATFRGAVLMNELSAFIWEKLQSPITRDGLLAEILVQYAIDEKTAAADLDAALTQLKQMGILEA